MKNYKRLLMTGLLLGSITFGLTACGGINTGSSKDTVKDLGYTDNAAVNSEDYYVPSNDNIFSSTDISGTKVDYSYDFVASGDVKTSKEDILQDYKDLQAKVDEKGGYIESVDNSYYDYRDKNSNNYYYRYDSDYLAEGSLSFVIQVKNEDAEDVIKCLDELCQKRGLSVTTYRQTIYNYSVYTIVDDEDDSSYYDQKITKEELDKKLAYTDIDVRLSYRYPRSGISKFGIAIANFFESLWNACGGVILVIFFVCFGIFVIWLESIALYKGYRKMMYNHKKKKPEYYEPKKIEIVNSNEIQINDDEVDSDEDAMSDDE